MKVSLSWLNDYVTVDLEMDQLTEALTMAGLEVESVTDRFDRSSIRGIFGGGTRVTLPDEEAGTIMVFKVYDRIGYGLVMEATSDIHVLDSVRNPT